MFKQTLLNNFIDQYKHLPEQGSAEWLALRKDFIGGSEVATILKQNKNKSVSKLVLEKLGFDPFKGNGITYWGTVFEELIRLHCEEVFTCTIRETGSIPYEHGSLSYSPDGLALISTNKLKQHFGSLTEGIDPAAPAQLVLFEFKCPHSRVATHEIPEHYWPQVNIGMNIINIMETAIFVQATYRRCPFRAIKHNDGHNPYGHFKRADTSGNPVECGFMVIYADEQSDYMDGLQDVLIEGGYAEQVHLLNGETVIDVGSINDSALMEEVLGNCVNKTFKVDYCFRHRYDSRVFDRNKYTIDMYDTSLQYRATKELEKQTEKHPHIICVMPFKMLNIYMTQVAKNRNYIADTGAHEQAKRVLQCINDHREMEPADKVSTRKSVRAYKL